MTNLCRAQSVTASHGELLHCQENRFRTVLAALHPALHDAEPRPNLSVLSRRASGRRALHRAPSAVHWANERVTHFDAICRENCKPELTTGPSQGTQMGFSL